jgi:hypothetical protein
MCGALLSGQQPSAKKGRPADAVGSAQRSMDLLGDDLTVDVTTRIAVRQTLADALCGIHACAKAIPLLQQAVELANSHFGAASPQAALAGFHLGLAYWEVDDFLDADNWMARSSAKMRAQLGAGDPAYVDAMQQYAKFLRQRGQLEAASAAEREVKRVEAMVDARSFTARGQ